MILSAFPGTPTGALELLLNITPIEEFLLLRHCDGYTESLLEGSALSTELVPLGKRKAMLMFAKSHSDSYFCCKCQLTEKGKPRYSREILNVKLWIKRMQCRSESVLNHNTAKVYADGSKLDGRVGAGFYAEYYYFLCRILFE